MGCGASATSTPTPMILTGSGGKARKRANSLMKVDELRPVGDQPSTIAEIERRGITLTQLEALLEYVDRHCGAEGWTSVGPATAEALLDPPRVTWYELMFWVVMPATSSAKCSYVELIVLEEQDPTWFVSHWWGVTVRGFVECLRGHSRDRSLAEDHAYWVCACAVNQWQATAEQVAESFGISAFRKAVDRAEGTITVLDDAGVTFSRVWCLYEIFVSVTAVRDGSKHLYDVYAPANEGKCVGLTDGAAAADFDMAHLKSMRESAFPLALASAAFAARIDTAEASVEDDARRILGAVAGLEGQGTEPPPAHTNYERVDRAIHGHFAVKCISSALASPEFNEELSTRFTTAMRESGMEDIQLDLDLAKDPATAMRVLKSSLPENLCSLSVTWHSTALGADMGHGLAAAIRDLSKLVRLKLDLEGAGIGAEGAAALAVSVGGLKCLERLTLRLASNGLEPEGTLSLVEALGKLPALTELVLYLDSNGLDGECAEALAAAVRASSSLRKVELGLSMNGMGAAGRDELEDLEEELQKRRPPVDISLSL